MALPGCGTRETEAPVVRQLGDDTFMTGNDVRLERETRGDAVLAGGSIAVRARVHGDGVFAGGDLELAGPFGSDVYAAGGQVHLTGEVARNGRFAGGTVTLGPQSKVRGGVSIAAGRAEIVGDIEQYLQVTANSTQLAGHVSGDVEVSGGHLQVEPSAVIGGNLVFRGAEAPKVAPGAIVRGEVRHVTAASAEPRQRWLGIALFALVVCLGMALAATLARAVWPGFTRAIESVIRTRPSSALVAGLGVVFGTPLLLMALGVSVIGIPLALLVLPLYLLSFPLGYLATCASAADWLLERARVSPQGIWLKRLLVLAIVLLAFSLVGLTPLIGWALMFVLTLVGVGGLVLASIEAHRGGSTNATEAPAPAASEWKPATDEKAPASA